MRIASAPIPEDESLNRDRLAHITNGNMSDKTERVLLHEVPELAERKLQDKVETFVAQLFSKHFAPDMLRRVSVSANQQDDNSFNVRKFGLAGLDLMVTSDERIYLLEVNVHPASPPESTVSESFQEHLVGFMRDIIDHVTGKPSPNFVSCTQILERKP